MRAHVFDRERSAVQYAEVDIFAAHDYAMKFAFCNRGFVEHLYPISHSSVFPFPWIASVLPAFYSLADSTFQGSRHILPAKPRNNLVEESEDKGLLGKLARKP